MDRRDDELPRVTLAHLRRADDGCARRLALGHADQRGNRGGAARFEVRSRLVADARVAHAVAGPADPSAFVRPVDLYPEEQRVYERGARAYLELAGTEPVELVGPEEVDPWSTDQPAAGVRLVVPLDLVVRTPEEHVELRIVRLATGTSIDDETQAALLLRVADWLGDRALRVRALDVWTGEEHVAVLGGSDAVDAARSWLADRVGRLRSRVARPVARAGAECGDCAYVAGCEAHRA